jgi:hypothetical protein
LGERVKIIPGEAVPGAVSIEDATRALETAIDVLKTRGPSLMDDPTLRDDTMRVFEKIARAFGVGRIEDEIALGRVMDNLGITSTPEGMGKLMDLLLTTGSASGAHLNRLSQLKKLLLETFTPAQLDEMGLAGVVSERSISSVVTRNTINTWRAAITGQFATAQRNFEVSIGMLTPLRMLDDVTANVARSFTSSTGIPVSGKHAMEHVYAILRKMSGSTRKRLDKFWDELVDYDKKFGQSIYDQLYGTPAMDVLGVAIPGRKKGIWAKVVDATQIFNRGQEIPSREIIFDALFTQRMVQRGIDPADVWRLGPKQFLQRYAGEERNAMGRWLTTSLRESVQGSLEQTFAASTQGKLGRWLTSTYDKFPAMALVHPFPRFLANSLKFLRDHSPFGVARFMSEGQRRAIATVFKKYGDKTLFNERIQAEAVEAIGKAMSGYTLFAGALAMRNSDMAGERWYEIKAGNRVIDARPFNPLAAYLLLAEAMRRNVDPEALTWVPSRKVSSVQQRNYWAGSPYRSEHSRTSWLQ